jgi:reactive intermediate/imine deaminase
MKYKLLSAVLMASLTFNALADHVKKDINTPNAPAPIGTYSQAIQWGHALYVSGQIPMDPKTSALVSGDFSAQTRQAFNNLNEIVKASGGDINNTLKLTIYLSDLSNFSQVNDVMQEYFHEPYPARAVIEVKSLPKQAPIEIEAIVGLTD